MIPLGQQGLQCRVTKNNTFIVLSGNLYIKRKADTSASSSAVQIDALLGKRFENSKD